MVRHGLAPAELQLPRAVVEHAPIAADGAFQQPLPRLVESLDQIDLPIAGLRCFHHAAQDQRLIGGRGERAVAHAAFARPAHLADQNFLPGKNLCHLLPHLAHMRGRFCRCDRLVLPIGQDVDGDEIGGGRELGRLQPELPDIGIGDGKAGPALHLLEIGLDPGGAELAAEQRLVTDDEGLDHTGMTAGEPQVRLRSPAGCRRGCGRSRCLAAPSSRACRRSA